jgi:hypothetical protein
VAPKGVRVHANEQVQDFAVGVDEVFKMGDPAQKTESGHVPSKSLFSECAGCRLSFFPAGLLQKRRCKDCGGVFCAPCTPHRALLPRLSAASGALYRVCAPCLRQRQLPPASFGAASAALRAAAPPKQLRALACLLAVEAAEAPSAAQHRYAAALCTALGAALGLPEDGNPILHPLLGDAPRWAADGSRVGAPPPGAPGSSVRAATAAGDAAEAGEPFFEVLPCGARERVALLAAFIEWLLRVGAYDARPRALLRGLCHRLGVAWADVAVEEDRLARAAEGGGIALSAEGCNGGVGGGAGGGGGGGGGGGSGGSSPLPSTAAAAALASHRGVTHSVVVATGALLGGAAAVGLGLAAGAVALPLAGVALGCKAVFVAAAVKVAGIGGGVAVVGKNAAAALKGAGAGEDALLVVEPLTAKALLSEAGLAALEGAPPEALAGRECPPPGFALTLGAAGPTFSGGGGGGGGGVGALLPHFVGPWGGYSNCLAAAPVPAPRAPPPLGAQPPPQAPPRAEAAAATFEGDRVSLSRATPAHAALLQGWLRPGATPGGDAYGEAFSALPWHGVGGCGGGGGGGGGGGSPPPHAPEAGAWLENDPLGEAGGVFLVLHPRAPSAAPIGFVAVGPAAPLPSRGGAAAARLSELRVCLPDSGLWSDAAGRALYLGSDALLTAVAALRGAAPGRKFLWRPPLSCLAGLAMVNNPHARSFPLCEGDQRRLAAPAPHYECVLAPSAGAERMRRCYMATMYSDPEEFEGGSEGEEAGEAAAASPQDAPLRLAEATLGDLQRALAPLPGGGVSGAEQTPSSLGSGWWRGGGGRGAFSHATGRFSAVMFAPAAQAAFFSSLRSRAAGGGAPPPPAPPAGLAARVDAALGLSRMGAALGVRAWARGAGGASSAGGAGGGGGGGVGGAPPLGLLHSLVGGVNSSLQATLGFLQLSRGAFSGCCADADVGGEALARWLLAGGGGGRRPVALIGYGFGARLMFSAALCLGRIAAAQEARVAATAATAALGEAPPLSERWPAAFSPASPRAVIMDLILLGAPVVAGAEEWRLVRGAVAGRVVNAFDGADSLLRAASLGWGLGGVPCGLQPVGARSWWRAAAPAPQLRAASPAPAPASPELSSDEEGGGGGGSGGGGCAPPPGAYDSAAFPVADVSAEQLAAIPARDASRAGSTLAAGTVFAEWWEGVESVDVGAIVGGRGQWERALPDILSFLGVA